MIKKKGIILLLTAFVVILIVGLMIVIERESSSDIPQNRFGITQEDTFSISDFGDNGVSGWYTITDFTQEEKIPILKFLAGLENEEVLKTEIEPDEVVFDYPPKLYAYKQDYRIVFILYDASNIEVRETDLNGHIKSRKKYETTKNAFETLYNKVGISDM